MKLAPDDKELLRNVAFVKPLPFVTEVIFLATPQRGSYLAGPQIVRRLAESLRAAAERRRARQRGGGDPAAHRLGRLALRSIPTSIDNMSPGNRFIKTLAEIPVSPGVSRPLDHRGQGRRAARRRPATAS